MLIQPAPRERILQEVQRFPDRVQAHIEAVRRKSVALAEVHGLDIERAELAAQTHDVCRLIKAPELLAMAASFAIPITPLERAFPVFLHGPVGACVIERDYGLADEAVLSAVRCHTMGKVGMSRLDQVLFLADKLDPSKMSRYPFIAEVDRLTCEDLDRAVLFFIDNQIQAFMNQGDLVHPGMAMARNDSILALRSRFDETSSLLSQRG